MKKNLKREICALRQMGEFAATPFCSDYISASRVLIGGVPCLYVYVDAYQLIRDHRGLPDAHKGLGRHNWNVDKWESERQVVFCGPVSDKKLYRGIMSLARRTLARVEEQAKRMYPKGRQEWVVRG
ncbi:hypothetical protein ACSFCT_25625 [Yokenella regensburgei]|uniref:hypothetical protein n=1 Tax=Yokenella regensburgei TaxID=158877 RepID=UPI003ED9B498